MSKQQQPLAQSQQLAFPGRVKVPGESESPDEYYIRIAQEKSAANLAKNAAIPSLNDYFSSEKREAEIANEKARILEMEKNPPTWANHILPPNDSLTSEAKRRHFAHEE
jgi:hypothetical protein